MPSDTKQSSSQQQIVETTSISSTKAVDGEKGRTVVTDQADTDYEERKMQQKLRDTNLNGQKPEDIEEVKIPAKRSREEDESTERNDNEQVDDQKDTKEKTPEPEEPLKPTVSSSPSPFHSVGVSPFSAVSRPMGASPFAAIKRDDDLRKDISSGGFGAFTGADMPSFRKFKSPQKKRRKEGESSPTEGDNEDQSVGDEEGSEDSKDQFGDLLQQKSGQDKPVKESTDQYIQVKNPLEEQKSEEDETTLFSVRAKLFVLDETKNWKERGVGNLKINIHQSPETKEICSSRLVMRTDAVYRVILNTPLFAGMTLESNNKLSGTHGLGDKFVRLVVLEDGRPVHLAIKVSNPNAALDLRSNIRKAIPRGPQKSTSTND